eukprot:TRINITY_DN18991_c0_g1_i1.p1 TRINITY_DN18991_c0_g1~~TRINITY_DN18991_c0_g1_i1.p1  ORF type:complete len:498 (+),score=61.18 TRINITY_DN18991_c0_g1_i1:75-1568(+)
MFQHLFVAEKSVSRTIMLCEVSLDRGETRAARVAAECVEQLNIAELQQAREAMQGLPPRPTSPEQRIHSPPPAGSPMCVPRAPSPFSPTALRRVASPCRLRPSSRPGSPALMFGSPPLSPSSSGLDAPYSPPQAADQLSLLEVCSDGGGSMCSRGRMAVRSSSRGRTSSLRRGERPGDRTNVRTSSRRGTRASRADMFDVEMPHRCGLKAVVIVDCALLFGAVSEEAASRDSALPLLRAMRREFIRCFRPDRISSLQRSQCQRSFQPTLTAMLEDGNRPHGDDESQYEIPANPMSRPLMPSTPVYLNVYNIVDVDVNSKFQAFGVGIHHSGVEVQGKEWSFGGLLPGAAGEKADVTGLFCIPPRTALPASHFKEQVCVGTTTKGPADIDFILSTFTSSDDWKASKYHLLEHNCNDFAAEFIWRLGRWEFPRWINRAAKVSATVLPDAVVSSIVGRMQQAPPADPPKAVTQRKPKRSTSARTRSLRHSASAQERLAQS